MKSVLPIVLIAIIVICGGWLLYYRQSLPEPGAPVKHLMPLACTSCGKAFAMEVSMLPAECPFCGERTVFRARQCVECGAIVPLPTDGGFRADPNPVQCLQCGGQRFREVPYEELEVVP